MKHGRVSPQNTQNSSEWRQKFGGLTEHEVCAHFELRVRHVSDIRVKLVYALRLYGFRLYALL